MPDRFAADPLYRDPILDGPTDPIVVWNPQVRRWWMFYTSRRANVAGLPGASWVHGTRIGIAESADAGATWTYAGTAEIDDGTGLGKQVTHWAPDVVFDGDTFHMFLTVVPGIFDNWAHPRAIVHLTSTDLRTWGDPRPLDLASGRVIDASLLRLPDGTWRLWYNEEDDNKSIYFADSPDLRGWTDRGKAIGDQPGEGPKAFHWRGQYWMITDVWQGLAVYRSDDALRWVRQPGNLLAEPARGGAAGIGHHADVVVSGDRAFLFYFAAIGAGREERRSAVHVTELELRDGTLHCERDRLTQITMSPPEAAP
ncbi:glycosyl hydrolase [Phytohabitans rumicis]|uniref:Glycosyl hydrolase n=1 Tax=Phytohabitans rumicis TaxID=1076125 RepID=A0A6V8L525_9ACTN|nr:glycosyl hydrolase [Phytohabitans rumicis]GFJ87745.1 glycosyl hydrolase [Phytohabitans rumicis]